MQYTKTSNLIKSESKAKEVIEKYLTKGNIHTIFNKIIETEGINFFESSFKNKDFLGMFTVDLNDTNVIIINKEIDNIGRKNFTIAHELGHYFLEHKTIGFCSDKEIKEDGENVNRIEQEANHFATCLLMPEQKVKSAFLSMLANSKKAKVKGFLCVKNDYTYSIWAGIRDDLIKRYGVSESALRYRLTKLNLTKFEIK